MEAAKLDTGTVVIPYHECLELLKTEEVGRIAVVVEGRPEIFPVNYVLHGNGILFRTDSGTKLVGATHGPVTFEVDRLHRNTRSGWSVIVHGRAALYTKFDSHAQQQASRLWLGTSKPHLIRVTPTTITGRRVPSHGPG
jgi:uncharacterized protein